MISEKLKNVSKTSSSIGLAMKLISILIVFLLTHSASASQPTNKLISGASKPKLSKLSAPLNNVKLQGSIINIADDFVLLYESTKEFPEKQREAYVAEALSKIFPDYYSDQRIKKINPKDSLSSRVGSVVKNFKSIETNYKQKEKALSKGLNQSLTSFYKTFPDFEIDRPIYIMHSLGEFNGATRKYAGKYYLLFGVDLMAKLHKWEDDNPFFHHELFHVYHEKKFDCEKPLWCGVWTEGLATYVSEVLNPSTNFDNMMLNFPENMANDTQQQLKAALSDVKLKFNSTESKDYSAYFNFRKDETGLPVRRGYYLGYLLAKSLGKQFDVNTLATMKENQVKALLEKEIDKLITESR